jgi:hypothetical protein
VDDPILPEVKGPRAIIVRGFGIVEDAVYVGMGILLAYSAASLLITGGIALWKATTGGAPLQVSFRAHTLQPEPFLIVGLIAATRRILVVTAEFSLQAKNDPAKMREGMLEIGLLTLMVLALVGSLLMLRGREVTKAPR